MEQCRICLTSCNNDFMSLIDENSVDGLSCYGKAVLTFANVSISSEDNMPKVMCYNCLKLLKYAINFKLTCEKNYITLKELSKRSTHTVPAIKVDTKIVNINRIVDNCDKRVDEINIKHNRNEMKDCGNSEIDEGDENDTQDDDMIDASGLCSDNDDVFDILDSYYNQTLQASKHSRSDNKNITNTHRRNFNNFKKTHNVEFDNLLKIMEDNLEAVMKEDEMDNKINNKPIKTDPNINSTESLTCRVCQKVLSNRSTLQAHMQRHDGYHFICEHCGKGFASRSELRYHLFNMHKEGTYMQCDQCDFKAIRVFDMKEHRRIHSGERPFACDKCGLTFRRRYIWKGHMENCHREKTIKCPECPRMFARRGCLLEHTNSAHRRLYVYSCTECAVTYAKIHTVRRHLADKHGISRERQGRVRRVYLNTPTAQIGQASQSKGPGLETLSRQEQYT